MATQKDVAARAGVSIAAVSYCINGTHNLNPETRARIQNAIKELNYIPNSQARNLKRQASRELCAIFPDLENLCYNEFLKGILMKAESSNYSLNISCSYNDISQEQMLITNAVSKHYAGIFLVTCQPQNTKFFQNIQQHHPIELVFLERLPDKMDVIYYGFDNYKTLHYLTSQLIKNGYRDIAPFLCTVRIAAARFQSTLPTRGSDKTRRDDSGRGAKFQSTLPTRGSDHVKMSNLVRIEVSIHAPHEGERRSFLIPKRLIFLRFNPRSPRGGATFSCRCCNTHRQAFQSTLPTRGSDLGVYLLLFIF